MICPPCQEGADKVNWVVTEAALKRKPVKNYEICATRLVRCRHRSANLTRFLRERAQQQ